MTITRMQLLSIIRVSMNNVCIICIIYTHEDIHRTYHTVRTNILAFCQFSRDSRPNI